jgi:hypothetical protein
MGVFGNYARYAHRQSQVLPLVSALEPLSQGLALWQMRQTEAGRLPIRRELPVTDLPQKLVGHTNLIDVERTPQGVQFRVRLYGTGNIRHSEFRPEGRLMEELELEPAFLQQLLQDYRGVVDCGAPILHRYEGRLTEDNLERDYGYDRLILPFGCGENEVVLLMVMTARFTGRL